MRWARFGREVLVAIRVELVAIGVELVAIRGRPVAISWPDAVSADQRVVARRAAPVERQQPSIPHAPKHAARREGVEARQMAETGVVDPSVPVGLQ